MVPYTRPNRDVGLSGSALAAEPPTLPLATAVEQQRVVFYVSRLIEHLVLTFGTIPRGSLMHIYEVDCTRFDSILPHLIGRLTTLCGIQSYL